MRYIIGDVHGCFEELQQLLIHIGFNRSIDELYFVGDLAGRGIQALEVISFIEQSQAYMVLGNYDIHLICCLLGWRQANRLDRFEQLIASPKASYYAQWLQQQALIIENNDFIISHAGMFPGFEDCDLGELNRLAQTYIINLDQTEQQRLFTQGPYYFPQEEKLINDQQAFSRFIVNACSSMRYLEMSLETLLFARNKFQLNWQSKGDYFTESINQDLTVTINNQQLIPWFKVISSKKPLFFGHWSTLSKTEVAPHITCVDTSCVYGGKISAYCVEQKKLLSIDCRKTR